MHLFHLFFKYAVQIFLYKHTKTLEKIVLKCIVVDMLYDRRYAEVKLR